MKYTAHEAAKILGVTPSAIYNAIARGKIKPKKFADIYTITEAQLRKLQGQK